MSFITQMILYWIALWVLVFIVNCILVLPYVVKEITKDAKQSITGWRTGLKNAGQGALIVIVFAATIYTTLWIIGADV